MRIETSGTYLLTPGAVTLRTQCFGTVTVTFTPPGGVEQNNMCDSPDGSTTQTNDVTGVTSVTSVAYTVDSGFAHVTVNP
ncbi:MAG: hypothetical protein OEU54_15170 [Gemmatimonadota bacterium]|nr:hypothetical protein [Gemmatimonadota bacterium]